MEQLLWFSKLSIFSFREFMDAYVLEKIKIVLRFSDLNPYFHQNFQGRHNASDFKR